MSKPKHDDRDVDCVKWHGDRQGSLTAVCQRCRDEREAKAAETAQTAEMMSKRLADLLSAPVPQMRVGQPASGSLAEPLADLLREAVRVHDLVRRRTGQVKDPGPTANCPSASPESGTPCGLALGHAGAHIGAHLECPTGSGSTVSWTRG